MVPDIVVKPAASAPVAAEKGTVQPGADGSPVFGEALRAACNESDAQPRPSSARPRDSRRCQGDASSAAWWACARPVAKDPGATVDDPQAAGVDQASFDVPVDDTSDAGPTEDDASGAIDSGAVLLAIQSQPIVDAQGAPAVLDAGVETGTAEDPGIATVSESSGEALTAEDVVKEALPQATLSKLPVPSGVKPDSAPTADAADTDRATEVAQSTAGADVDRPDNELAEADAHPTHSEEVSHQTTATRKMLDLPSSSARPLVDQKASVEAAKPTVATERSVAAASSTASQPSEAGGQTLPSVAAPESAEPPRATVRDSSSIPADTVHFVAPESAGSEADQRQAEHGRSQQDQHEQVWRPYVSPQSVAGRMTALFAPGLALLQGSDGILALMPAVEAPSLAPPARIPGENLDELVQTMRVMVRGSVSEATVRLRPEHLGDVSVAVRVDGKVVTATVTAESAGVREWLKQHEEALRAGLQQQGLTLDRLVVQREARQERREQHPEARRSRPRRGQGPQPRFEVSA